MVKRRRLVEVTWLDSGKATAAWLHHDDSLKLVVCKTVGHVVEKTRRKLVIAGSYTDGGQYGEATAIPRAAVTKVRRLR